MDDSLDTISVPAEPVAGARSPFPIVASIAPVVASVVIFFLTRSPFVLAFAALGPVIAIASVIDNRWSTRRRLRADTANYRAELTALTAAIDARHADERRLRRGNSFGARTLLDDIDTSPGAGFGRWRVPVERRTTVVVGNGEQPSGLRVDGPQGHETARVKSLAARVSDVPVEIDAAAGIGIVGPAVLTRAFARGLLVQLCNAAGPEALAVVEVPDGWEWTESLPHRGSGGATSTLRVQERSIATGAPTASRNPGDRSDVVLVLADRIDSVPTRCAHVVEFVGVTSARLYRTTATGLTRATDVTVDLVSEAEAALFAIDLADQARHAGVLAPDDGLPSAIGLDAANARAPLPSATSLSAVIGTSGTAPVVVDIVADGPHAIVGGTTGSGKSELLVTWVTSLADRYPPSEVNLLLVDFKGGAAFAPLLRLPHVVGVVTDLDAVSAARALESLRAEVRWRERLLRDAGARDIAEVSSLPRLVIVVDEFAAMLDGYPDLHALFVDVAARGRSLGMHLVLCTQRPAGVVRDSLLANCGLRMSLRVNNRADSTAILGADVAAFLPATIPGRLALAGQDGVATIQVASTSERDIGRAADHWPVDGELRRPWLDPLPASVERASLAGGSDGIRIGLADLPAEQRQETAVWDPDTDGSLLVIGMARTGKTTLLDTIATEVARLDRCVVERVGADVELAWDVVHSLVDRLARRTSDSGEVLVLVDDLDSLLAGIDADDAVELRDGVLALLRDGPRRRIRLVITMQRLAGPIGALGGFVGSTVLLGTANRQEHLLAGGESVGWVEGRRAGSALWRGVAIQLCAPERAATGPRHAASRTVVPIDWHTCPLSLVVSGTPARRAAEIRARNASGRSAPIHVAALGDATGGRISVDDVRRSRDGPVVIVGDSDQWQAHWSLLNAMRESATIIVEGCSPAEFRAVTRIRARLPLLERVAGRAWSCSPGGEVTRVSLEAGNASSPVD